MGNIAREVIQKDESVFQLNAQDVGSLPGRVLNRLKRNLLQIAPYPDVTIFKGQHNKCCRKQQPRKQRIAQPFLLFLVERFFRPSAESLTLYSLVQGCNSSLCVNIP